MSSTAKFLAPSPKVNHPNRITVFFIKECDDFFGFFGEGNFVAFQFVVEQEFLVGNSFDFFDLFGFDSLEVGKVETQSIWLNQ